jgi:hypothetical protein
MSSTRATPRYIALRRKGANRPTWGKLRHADQRRPIPTTAAQMLVAH